MPRITPVSWKVLECIFKKAGFVFERQIGSHRSYSKPNISRPLIIPKYKEIDSFIINRLLRTAKMDRETYFKYLKDCK